MAVGYVNRKCESCGSRKFQYNEKSKTWTCLYCGNTTEREAKYDGLFTINNVVRQSLLDISFRKLESAENNLTECEKIDSKYIGTIIANIACLIIKASTPGETNQQELKNIISKIKRYNDILQKDFSIITDDEEVMYEFFDDSNIYATLLLTFDSISDKNRSEHMEKYIKLGEIDSTETNKSLLNYSLNNGKLKMIDEVIKNGNMDRKFALSKVLQEYSDNGQKVENVKALLVEPELIKDDISSLESYFSESGDSIQTKSGIFHCMAEKGLKIGTDVVIKHLLQKTENVDIAGDILTQLCRIKLTDEDVSRLVDFNFQCQNFDIAVLCFDALKTSSQYVVLEQRHLSVLFSRGDLSPEAKVGLLDKAFGFNIETRQRESILNNYLCFNQDKVEDRKIIIPFLLKTVKTVPTNTVENYVLNNKTDGEFKVDVIRNIMLLDINISFFNDLLSRYMMTVTDSTEVKNQIMRVLADSGIKLDQKSFGDYVCCSEDDPVMKIEMIKMLMRNGCRMKGDTLNNYLLRIKDPKQFSPELFTLLLDDCSTLSDEAMKNYLLLCGDRNNAKVINAGALSKKLANPFGSYICSIEHSGSQIDCSLLQAYILLSEDEFEVAVEIVNQMLAGKVKINAEIRVRPSGVNEKFKKYVVSNKEKLSPLTNKLCDRFKVYSMLF